MDGFELTKIVGPVLAALLLMVAPKALGNLGGAEHGGGHENKLAGYALPMPKATEVKVCLKESPDRVKLTITDNGIGFDSSQEFSGRLGLKSMSERASALGGSFILTSSVGRGTTIAIDIPRGEL